MRSAAFGLFGILLLSPACGGDGGPTDPGENNQPPPPQYGHIQVSTATSGADLDPDGYTVSMDGATDRSIGLDGVTTFIDVEVGSHQVTLGGLADNCSADGSNPATTSVAKDATAQVAFDVGCEALPVGNLEVSTTVTNNFDPDGFQVFAAGVTVGSVAVNGSAKFDDLPAGAQQVELTGIAPNCEVDGDNPTDVTIPTGGSVAHTFSVTCTNPPDGRIVYTGYVSGRHGIAVMESDGSDRLLIFETGSTEAIRRPRWSPDGKTIAFVLYDWAQDGYREVFTIDQAGGQLTQVTDMDGYADNPSWSPDGTRIAFDSGTECCGGALYVVNADGTGLAEIPRDDRMFHEESPGWSPDGSKIVFAAYGEDYGNAGVFVMDATGGSATQITADAPICTAGTEPEWRDGIWWGRPAWSPDGSRIAFARTYNGHCNAEDTSVDLIVINQDGTGETQLTTGPDWELLPSWSPDGSKIVYDGGNWSIHVVNVDGTGGVAIIPPSNSAISDPDWGP